MSLKLGLGIELVWKMYEDLQELINEQSNN